MRVLSLYAAVLAAMIGAAQPAGSVAFAVMKPGSPHVGTFPARLEGRLPTVKATADLQLAKDHGAGVVELVHRICSKDSGIVEASRHGISLGIDRNGNEVLLKPFDGNVLISGSSGVGKSTLATALTERMAEKRFEFCR
jgi:hypothetical protein